MSSAAFKALLADIRAASEAEIIGAGKPKPVKASKPKPPEDPLVREVTDMLAPILARSEEKADMLVDHLKDLTGRTLSVRPGGLAATIKALRKSLPDEHIRDGAYGLRVKVQREFSLREKVK